jgi:hypothetical protein
MKITKILVALSFLFAISTAQAGEMTVTGSMQATYQSESDATTGNPLGMDREITFSGSTELDNGISMSVMQDFGDDGAFGNGKITFGNVGGMVDIYVGTDGSEIDAVDDITPNAFEEANATSGTYQDVGGLADEMGIGIKMTLPIIGSVSGQYVPKADGGENADKAASGDTNGSVGSGSELVIKTALGDLPVVGGFLGGNTLTMGYAEEEVSTINATSDRLEGTVALTGSYGNFSYGYQKDFVEPGQTTATAATDYYVIDQIGLAYAVNDALTISYQVADSRKKTAQGESIKTEAEGFSAAYTMGGMTIAYVNNDADNANYTDGADRSAQQVVLSVAF